MKQSDGSGNLKQLGLQLETRLKELRYSPDTINNYQRVFDWLGEFMDEGDSSDYSPSVGKRFLKQYPYEPHRPDAYFRNARVLVARLDELLEDGQHVIRHYNTTAYRDAFFPLAQQSYSGLLENRGNKPTTIKQQMRYLGCFLEKLSGKGLESLADLDADLLIDILTELDHPYGYLPLVKSFLAFLYGDGQIKENLSTLVPRQKRQRPLPSIYTGEEIDRILKAVDLDTPAGKRDYAALMLAVHLGLRSSDITNLALSDIDFTRREIHIIQVKTGLPLTLPFDHEVDKALKNYIANARPDTGSDKVILAAVAPYFPLRRNSIYQLVDKYIDIAGIEKAGRKSGPHALRQCAVDVPRPTGAFAELLRDTGEV